MVEFRYPWLPARCSSCSKWGHKQEECAGEARVLLAKNSDKETSQNSQPEGESGRGVVSPIRNSNHVEEVVKIVKNAPVTEVISSEGTDAGGQGKERLSKQRSWF